PSRSLHTHLPPRHLHSFPTRRSSDLRRQPGPGSLGGFPCSPDVADHLDRIDDDESFCDEFVELWEEVADLVLGVDDDDCSRQVRSEEHTSELQSPYDLVCRLLLEKKK